MNNYLCKKCAKVVLNTTTPHQGKCSKGEGHEWTWMGAAGEKIYLCHKCKAWMNVTEAPADDACPSGRGNHFWVKQILAAEKVH